MFSSFSKCGDNPPYTDMNDGNESGKDGELVCTGMVWKRRQKGCLGLCERQRPFQTRCVSEGARIRRARKTFGNRKQDLCYRRKLVLLQGSRISDASGKGGERTGARCKGQKMRICGHAKQTPNTRKHESHWRAKGETMQWQRGREKCMESRNVQCCEVASRGPNFEGSHIPNDKPPGRSVPPCGFSGIAVYRGCF